MSLLELVGVTKRFGGLLAVDNLDVSVEERGIRGLIGPNGAGKTTVFNLITGFTRPSSGKIMYRKKNIAGKGPDDIARMGIVRTFQLTNVFKNMTALQNVVVACHLHTGTRVWGQLLRMTGTRSKEKAVQEKSTELLDFVGIADMKDAVAQEMPHGSLRALGIAIALAAKPQLLLLDEPFTGMNPNEVANMISIIENIRDRGTTIFLVEHNMSAVMSICDQITVLNFGKKIADGLPREIVEDKAVIEAYLGQEESYA